MKMISTVKFALAAMCCAILISTLVSCRPVSPSIQRQFTEPTPIFVVDAARLQNVQRIGILGFENGTTWRGIEPGMRQTFATALRESSGCPVVDLSAHLNRGCDFESVLTGEYPIQILASAWRNYHVDAVIFTRINHYHPFPPLSIGLTSYIVDTKDARLLATLDHTWSLAQPDVMRAYRDYLLNRMGESKDLKVFETSPATFSQYIWQQFSQQLRQSR